TLSWRAAQLFFSSLQEAERRGVLEDDLFVLELGIGVGLFARFFLDGFQALCTESGKDYYDRLCYIAGDYSDRMLLDACRHGIFADHPGRYILRVTDALRVDEDVRRDPLFQDVGKPFRAVFLNYVLDCLPAAVLRERDGQAQQLCVRTCLARGAEHGEMSRLDV